MGPAGAAATGAVGAIVGGTSGIITGFFSPSVIELLDDEIGWAYKRSAQFSCVLKGGS